ncbi:hypothetical protein BP5796_12544 [Coleophoma crateriformis]|uniref:Uncharacterized protein n=1 Tax=Coleophoma crateriformis TaxID=565419 RepID=A0A3D8Q7E8_9HELO|nr:hypothetical protein BP5796_12544 [Coleophoma crateriformis]
MAAPSSDLKNTDLVLSISAESVQKQIQALYNTLIEDTGEYVIPRVLEIRKPKEGGGYYKTGLVAYCECPTIDFSGDKMTKSNTAKYTTARISFKLKKNPKTGADAVINYFSEKEEGIVPEVINDYTMGWEINVGFKNIQQILQDVVNRSNVPSTASKALGQYIDSRVFTVSSLFCSFQSAQMARSFAVYDSAGNVVRGDAEEAFINGVTAWYKDHDDGTPNKNNPFILGYTISQNIPKISEVNKAAVKPPPEYFIPSSFRCSLSPRVPPPMNETDIPMPLPSRDDLCSGTINYLLRTFRPEGIAAPPPLLEGDGYFPSNPFSVMKRKATPGGLDGLMVISAATFNSWFAPHFEVAYGEVLKYVNPRYEKNYNIVDGKRHSDQTPICNRFMQGRTHKRENYTVLLRNDFAREDNGYTFRVFVKVRSNVDVAYSNLATNPDDGDDLKHAVKIVITSKNEISNSKYTREINFWGTAPEAADEEDPAGWSLSRGSLAWLNFRYEFTLRPDPANRGSLQLTLDAQSHHGSDGRIRTFERRRQGSDPEWGAWSDWESESNIQGLAEAFGGSMQSFATEMASFGSNKLTDAVAKLGETFKSSIILPAAEVFMFKGIDVDENGNLYVGVAYDTPTSEQVSRKAN